MQRKLPRPKTKITVTPWHVLMCALVGGFLRFDDGDIFSLILALFYAGGLGWAYIRESRRQPDRAIEFSLAANAALLLLLGFILNFCAFHHAARDIYRCGSLLAVAAVVMDQFTRWEAKRQTAAATVSAVTSVQIQPQTSAPTAAMIPAPPGTPAASPAMIVGAPHGSKKA